MPEPTRWTINVRAGTLNAGKVVAGPIHGFYSVSENDVEVIEAGPIEAEIERLRTALQDALTGMEVAANMGCTCTGYYECNGCESAIAQQAEDTADLIREALGMTKPADPERRI